jgi:hypothetical protein
MDAQVYIEVLHEGVQLARFYHEAAVGHTQQSAKIASLQLRAKFEGMQSCIGQPAAVRDA